MTTESWAGFGLGVYTVALVVAFGLRTWLHRRATGSTGFRGISGRPGSAAWWGGVLFPVALVLGLVGLVLAAVGVGPETAWPLHPIVAAAGLALAVVGLGVTVWGQAGLGTAWRIGVCPEERTALVSGGPFRHVRNPIFTGMVAVSVGVALMVPSVLTITSSVCLAIAVQIQVRIVEEPYLARVHGGPYTAYTTRAGRFLPGIGRSRPVTSTAKTRSVR